ncbi:MAG TPA: IS4 family transposase [bacterium]|nr:IS4 family transposase [bacterium]
MAAASATPPAVPSVNLAQIIKLLHTHLTAALCNTVFQRVRNRERQRRWSLAALAQFWLTVLLTGPRSLTQALRETGIMFPHLGPAARTSPEAFFQRAERLRPDFFRVLYDEYVAHLVPEARTTYAAAVAGVRERFSEVWILDGTRLDAVAHRLKLTWDVRSPLLPGCLLVCYDLFRGFPRRLSFCADAGRSELQHALEQLPTIPQETLLIADRLFASVKLVAALTHGKGWLLCRRNRRLTLRHQRWLRRGQFKGGTLMERLVLVGSGQGTPPQLMRQIRYTQHRLTIDLLTSVLDPRRLPAKDALACYRLRWQVERLFSDLKGVLDLHHFYLASPRGVAQQVYVAAMVYAAMRVAQARIAGEHDLTPEELSPTKLFPRLARASLTFVLGDLHFEATQQVNPRVRLIKPDWSELPPMQVALPDLLVEPRRGKRRKRRFCASRHRWKSFAHVRGARKFELC